MSLQVWLPLNQGPKNVITDISNFGKEGGISITADTNGWYKIADSSHTSSRWGIYKDFYVKSNTTYTLNVYAKSTTGVAANVGIQSFNGYTNWPAQRETYSGSSEKLITFTWTTAATDNYARVYLAMNPGSTIANNYVFYKGVEILEAPEIKNQGVAEVVITNDGADYESNGKIGGCYNLTNGPINISNLPNPSEISISFWFKRTANTNTRQFMFTAWNGVTCELTTDGKPTFAVYRSNYPTITGTTAITTSTGWVHYCGTFNSTNGMKMYINGELVGSNSNITAISWSTTVGQIGKYSSYASMSAQINDFRIYDNALSAEEVKKLSQGLVLHYSLTNQYIESTTNLITTEDGLSNTCYNGATSKYGYGTNTDMYKTLGTFEGRKSTKVYMGTAGLSAYPYVYFDNFNAAGTTIQTLSFYYFPTLQNTIIPYSYNGSYNFSYKTDKASGSATNVSQIIIPVDVGRWNYITITAQKYDTTNTSRGIGYIRIGSTSHTSTTSNYWLFNNVQVEAKDHATGYAGVGGTRTSTIVQDSSGFSNNGIINGNFTINNNTSKYKISTICNGTSYISLAEPLTETKTIAVWVNWDTIPSGQSVIFVDYGSGMGLGLMGTGILCSTSNAGASYTYSKANLAANTWYHFVIVKTGTTARKLYINGVEQTATSNTSQWTYSINQLQLGKRSTTSDGFVGKLSDFRAYATALSAEDVLALYNNKNF